MTVLQMLGSAVDGGAEAYYVRLTGALARAGVRQVAALRRHPGRQAALDRLGVPRRPFAFGGRLDLLTSYRVSRFARSEGATVALAWMNRAAWHMPKGPWARVGRLGNFYDLKYYRGMEAMVGITTGICDYIAAGGWPRERVFHIPNFSRREPAPPVSRADFGTPDGAPLLLSLGRLHAVKAHDVTLRALARLPDAHLWIAGSGPLQAELAALAEALGVSPRVRFLGWRDDISALFDAADLCVFPSREEPHGTVVVDSWAHDKPLVVSRAVGPSELVRDGEDGLMFPIDDAEALAAAIRLALGDAALRNRLVAGGRARMADTFSEAAAVRSWSALFATVAGAHAR